MALEVVKMGSHFRDHPRAPTLAKIPHTHPDKPQGFIIPYLQHRLGFSIRCTAIKIWHISEALNTGIGTGVSPVGWVS
jgi:hypothetical protein